MRIGLEFVLAALSRGPGLLRSMSLALLLMLAPIAAAADQGLHLSAAAGIGSSEDYLGLQLQLRAGHFAVFGAIGPLAMGGLFSEYTTYSAAVGARWYSGEEGN